ncbi:PREDICTED: uncharacterized protein LOC109353082 [Lupinus angustifolius]|uniref:uncharacterized protein LOC109353082 n=1 Tax=Lupinus angustifolius TaxID=3871 RepID=UPI00092E3BB1|nr:PREDICTED: uncharacterized protein LOC109353082 [Lupinus angustifolius]
MLETIWGIRRNPGKTLNPATNTNPKNSPLKTPFPTLTPHHHPKSRRRRRRIKINDYLCSPTPYTPPPPPPPVFFFSIISTPSSTTSTHYHFLSLTHSLPFSIYCSIRSSSIFISFFYPSYSFSLKTLSQLYFLHHHFFTSLSLLHRFLHSATDSSAFHRLNSEAYRITGWLKMEEVHDAMVSDPALSSPPLPPVTLFYYSQERQV